MNKRSLVLDAAIDQGVIRGTLTAASGECRGFHGWLELSTGLEAMQQAARTQQPHGPAQPETDLR